MHVLMCVRCTTCYDDIYVGVRMAIYMGMHACAWLTWPGYPAGRPGRMRHAMCALQQHQFSSSSRQQHQQHQPDAGSSSGTAGQVCLCLSRCVSEKDLIGLEGVNRRIKKPKTQNSKLKSASQIPTGTTGWFGPVVPVRDHRYYRRKPPVPY
jgi:hypothetical protein